MNQEEEKRDGMETQPQKKNGQKWRAWLLGLACLVCALLLLADLMRLAKNVQRSLGICVVRLTQTISGPEIEKLRENWEQEDDAAFPAVFWQEQKGELVKNARWGRSASVTALAVCGSSGLLFPGQAVLLPEDTKGCLIDRQTSWQLFGDDNAIGNTVEYQGSSYQVRGILQQTQPVFAYVPQGTAQNFSCLAVWENDGSGVWQDLQSRGGLTGRQSVRYEWNLRWLAAEGSAQEKIREILYGENNVLEIRYLETAARMFAEAAGAVLLAAFIFVAGAPGQWGKGRHGTPV